jgi:hypothetical protein
LQTTLLRSRSANWLSAAASRPTPIDALDAGAKIAYKCGNCPRGHKSIVEVIRMAKKPKKAAKPEKKK